MSDPRMNAAQLKAANARHLWHPMAHPQAMRDAPPDIIVRGEGSWIWDVDGHKLVVTELDRTAFHTGRPLYRVACETCGVLVHPGSTAADLQVENHLRYRALARGGDP